MKKNAILTNTRGWSNKLARILDALDAGKIGDLAIYVEDESMKRIVEQSLSNLESRTVVHLLCNIPEGEQIIDNWQIGVRLEESNYIHPFSRKASSDE